MSSSRIEGIGRRPYIKVCGITRAEDAQAAVAAGARALGFVFVPESPRRISPEEALTIGADLPLGVARVGVVANLSTERVRGLVQAAGLTAIQAHGREEALACRGYGVPVVKVWWGGPSFRVSDIGLYRGMPILFDARAGEVAGGTGARADWDAAREAKGAGFKVLLAGGLGPENVRAAVEAVWPVAVDLNSAVEVSPGIKDPERIRAAVAALSDLLPLEESTWPW